MPAAGRAGIVYFIADKNKIYEDFVAFPIILWEYIQRNKEIIPNTVEYFFILILS